MRGALHEGEQKRRGVEDATDATSLRILSDAESTNMPPPMLAEFEPKKQLVSDTDDEIA